MEKHIHKLFNEKILMEAVMLFDAPKETVKKVGGFENFIYEYTKDNENYILRISHSDHRSKELVESELDFVNFLSQNGANVSKPVFSINHELVEMINIDSNTYFTITSYIKAKGSHMSKDMISESLLINYGKTVGKFHRLTKKYKPNSSLLKRYEWFEDLVITEAKKYLPSEETEIYHKLDQLLIKLKTFPKNIRNYGLIHTDIHAGNFFVYRNELTVFDFDDCEYHYFVSDIAISLFYFIASIHDDDTRKNKARYFMKWFMKGYLKENDLDYQSYMQIVHFLKLREIILYIVIFRSCDLENDDWAKRYVSYYRERIINDVPFINIDFSSFYD